MRALLPLPLLLSMAAPCPEPPPDCPETAAIESAGPGSSGEELERAAQLVGAAPGRSLMIRRGGERRAAICGAEGFAWSERIAADAEEPSVRLLPLRLDGVANSRYPSGTNDRLLWAGRGVSAQLSGGVAARWRWFSAAVAPEVAWQQNHELEIAPNGRAGPLVFMSPWYGNDIDLPQRFGAGPFASFAPGQSFVRIDAFDVGLGFTTEALWLGPGIRNSLLMTDTAPGVPRAFLGTSRPADVRVGKLEAYAFWGWLERTRWFPDRGHPLLTGLAVTFEPRWIRGLYVGAARVFVQPGVGLGVRDYLVVFQSPWKSQTRYWAPSGDNPLDNQLGALWFRWVLPASGFELYGEWGKEDYSGVSLSGFFQDPGWTEAWLLGLQKLFRSGRGWIRVQAEATHLQELRGPSIYSWYTHASNLGYTNDGQPLGAGIGPGGDAQLLAIDWLSASGRIGGYVERVERNQAAFFNFIASRNLEVPGNGHDAELTAAVRQLLYAGPVEVGWELGAQYRWNRDFLRHEANLRGLLHLTARFDRPRAPPSPPREVPTPDAPISARP